MIRLKCKWADTMFGDPSNDSEGSIPCHHQWENPIEYLPTTAHLDLRGQVRQIKYAALESPEVKPCSGLKPNTLIKLPRSDQKRPLLPGGRAKETRGLAQIFKSLIDFGRESATPPRPSCSQNARLSAASIKNYIVCEKLYTI